MPKTCSSEDISGSIINSYVEVEGVNHLDKKNLPSKRAIALICEGLLQILFPGYHDEQAISMSEMKEKTQERIDSLIKRLEREIYRALNCQSNDDEIPKNPPPSRKQAHELTCDFLSKIPEVRKMLRTDVKAAYEGDPAAKNFDEIILAYPCIEAIATQRMAHILYNAEIPLIPRIMTEWAHDKTGIDIHPGAKIGSHFFIDHGTGVVIGETCEIGSHVKLYHGVTLGARSFAKDKQGRIIKGIKRHPNVEDNVTIYPNSTILGGRTTIGKGSTIGANVFLMESLAPNTLIAVQPKDVDYFKSLKGGNPPNSYEI